MASQTGFLITSRRNTDFGPTARTRRVDHWFYTAMAFAIASGVFGGFARTYFARTYFHSPALPLWVQFHGAAFTAWMLLYLLQNLLAMTGGMKLHRNLGLLGLVLSVAVVFLGMAITIRQIHQGRFFPFPDAYSDLAVSTGQMVLFAVFMAIGLLRRSDAETHKRLMLMAPQLFFFPAFGRLLQGINATTLLLALAFYLAGPVYDLLTRRRVHPAYRWGVPLLIATMPPFGVLESQLIPWRHFVDWLVRA